MVWNLAGDYGLNRGLCDRNSCQKPPQILTLIVAFRQFFGHDLGVLPPLLPPDRKARRKMASGGQGIEMPVSGAIVAIMQLPTHLFAKLAIVAPNRLINSTLGCEAKPPQAVLRPEAIDGLQIWTRDAPQVAAKHIAPRRFVQQGANGVPRSSIGLGPLPRC